MTDTLSSVIELIDHANSQDPNIELSETGVETPKELLYAQRMSKTLATFLPAASAHLQIAARAQHIERWTSPRSDYPEGRSGYKKWRANLGLFHAERTGELMATAGFSQNDIDRVKYLVQKRGLKRDEETQALEDVICLVFLEFYLVPFAKKHSHEKLIDIIQKTWGKMSANGHQAALALPLDEEMSALVGEALS